MSYMTGTFLLRLDILGAMGERRTHVKEELRKGGVRRFTNPRAAARIMEQLHSGAIRSSQLVESVAPRLGVSSSTVHSTLIELVHEGFVRRTQLSRKNVQYELTSHGKSIVEDELAKNRNLLIESIEASPEALEISIEALAAVLSKMLAEYSADPEFKRFVFERLSRLVDGEIEAYRQLFQFQENTRSQTATG